MIEFFVAMYLAEYFPFQNEPGLLWGGGLELLSGPPPEPDYFFVAW